MAGCSKPPTPLPTLTLFPPSDLGLLLISLPRFCTACAAVQTDPADTLTDDGRQRLVRHSHLQSARLFWDWTG
jgi:hypothetical protein